MKFPEYNIDYLLTASPPARGAWIEMEINRKDTRDGQSPPARGAWIEIGKVIEVERDIKASPPARGAWIEI